jgi:hypothetical protein
VDKRGLAQEVMPSNIGGGAVASNSKFKRIEKAAGLTRLRNFVQGCGNGR